MSDSLNVGGVILGPQTDLVALLRRQMLEGSVWSVFRDQGPEEGLDWAMAAVRSTPLESRMIDAVMQLLTDPDTNVRSRSVTLAKNFASRFSSEALLKLLKDRPELFEGVKSNTLGHDPDLAWGLLEAIAGHPLANNEVRDRLRNAALDPKNGSRLLAALTQEDADWVLQHADALVTANSDNPEIILANLSDASQRQAFVQKLRGQPQTLLRQVLDAIDGTISDPTERAELRKLALSA